MATEMPDSDGPLVAMADSRLEQSLVAPDQQRGNKYLRWRLMLDLIWEQLQRDAAELSRPLPRPPPVGHQARR
jgi:hypothetical protein